MNNKAIKQLLEIKENYLKSGDMEQLEKSINALPPEMVELFKAMNKHIENEEN